MTLNEKYFNEYIKRQLFFLKFQAGQMARINNISKLMQDELILRFLSVYIEGTTTLKQKRQFVKKLGNIDAIYNNSFKKIINLVKQDIYGVGKSEYLFNKEFFSNNLGVPVSLVLPSKAQLLAIATKNPLLGRPFFYERVSDGGSWLTDLSKSQAKAFKTRVTQSFYNGESLSEAMRGIKGTKSLKYSDGIFKKTQKNIEAVVRTGFRFMQSEALNIVQNELGATHLQYTSILDGRTTAVCGQRDGNIYKIIEAPQIPAHFNCRSVYISYFGQELIGDRSYISDTRTRKTREVDFRTQAKENSKKPWKDLSLKQRNDLIKKERAIWAKENIGTVPIRVKYPQWFNSQSDSFKRNFLGQSKFDILQKKGLSYNQLINGNRQFFTIEQLNNKYK